MLMLVVKRQVQLITLNRKSREIGSSYVHVSISCIDHLHSHWLGLVLISMPCQNSSNHYTKNGNWVLYLVGEGLLWQAQEWALACRCRTYVARVEVGVQGPMPPPPKTHIHRHTKSSFWFRSILWLDTPKCCINCIYCNSRMFQKETAIQVPSQNNLNVLVFFCQGNQDRL
ncbi:hypothetical protein SEVIR_3G092001v4 [Setaria viridis]